MSIVNHKVHNKDTTQIYTKSEREGEGELGGGARLHAKELEGARCGMLAAPRRRHLSERLHGASPSTVSWVTTTEGASLDEAAAPVHPLLVSGSRSTVAEGPRP